MKVTLAMKSEAVNKQLTVLWNCLHPQIWVSPGSQAGRFPPVLGKIGLMGEEYKSMIVTKPILRYGRSGVFS